MKQRRHKGDFMSPKTRSRVMSRIKGKDTAPERAVAGMLEELGVNWDSHARDLPGRPDFVIRERMIVIFVDGDFWHGWQFPRWKDKLSPKWEQKIEATRKRDASNCRKLRRQGWRVVRIWEHQLAASAQKCKERLQFLTRKQ